MFDYLGEAVKVQDAVNSKGKGKSQPKKSTNPFLPLKNDANQTSNPENDGLTLDPTKTTEF